MTQRKDQLFDFISQGEAEKIKQILDQNDIVLEDFDEESGYYPIGWAIQSGQLDIVKLLCENGADVRKAQMRRAGHGIVSGLYVACIYSYLDIAKFLIDHDPKLVTIKTKLNWTALHCAALKTNSGELIEHLIDSGSDIDAQTYDKVHQGHTALHLACQDNNFNCAKLLVKKKKQQLHEKYGSSLNNIDEEMKIFTNKLKQKYFTPLHVACVWTNNPDLIKMLINAGSDAKMKSIYNRTCLHQALMNGNFKIVRFLLEYDRSLILDIDDEDRNVLHHLAMSSSSVYDQAINEFLIEMCQHFEESRQFLHKKDAHGETPFLLSISSNWNVRQFCYFYNAGSNPFETDNLQQSIFHLICRGYKDSQEHEDKMCFETLDRILKKDTSILRSKDKISRTPLYIAVQRNKKIMVEYLLKKNSSIIDDGPCGTTPLIHAIRYKLIDIAKVLLEYNADIEKLGRDYLSPMDLIDIYEDEALNCLIHTKKSQSASNFNTDSQNDRQETLNFFKNLSMKYPVCNDSNDDWVASIDTSQMIYKDNFYLERAKKNATNDNNFYLERATKYILGDFHLNPEAIEYIKQLKAVKKSLSELKLHYADCPDESNCNIDQCDVIRALFHLFEGVESNVSSELKTLSEIHLVPMGSAIEGTRVGYADEADFSIKFIELLDVFYLKDDDAMIIYVDEDKLKNKELLKYCDKVENEYVLSYSGLYRRLIDSIDSAISRLFQEGKVHPKLSMTLNSDCDITKCEDCKKINNEEDENSFVNKNGAMTHCAKCLPGVTMKKMGININLIWTRHDGTKMHITTDIIPTFNFLNVSPIDIQASVIKTMKVKKPIGCRQHVQKFINRDLIFIEKYEENSKKGTCSVSIKRINYFQENEYVVNPIQYIDISSLKGIQKEIYKWLKLLKDITSSDLKSYYIKRLVTQDEFLDLTEGDSADNAKIASALKLMITSYNPELIEMLSKLHHKLDPSQKLLLHFDEWDVEKYWQLIPLKEKIIVG